MTPREAETSRRRRVRREARERAYREWVCGGPLMDVFQPVIGGPGDAQHAILVRAELEQRALAIERESRLLAYDFTRRCLVVRAERIRMWARLMKLLREVGRAGVQPSYSTSSDTATTTGTTIPRL